MISQPDGETSPPFSLPEVLRNPNEEEHLARLRTTQTVREMALDHVPPAKPRSPFSLLVRPEGYIQNFEKVYCPPSESPSVGVIEKTCQLLIGEPNFNAYTKAMKDSRGFIEAMDVIHKGGKLALIGPHEQLVDTGIMLATFIYCYQQENPDIWQQRVKRSRTFVGPIIEELELPGVGFSAMQGLQMIGGIFKGFPQSETTEEKRRQKLIDPDIMDRTNKTLLFAFKRQDRRDEFDTISVSPSGKTDKHGQDAKGRDFHILHPVSSSTVSLLEPYYLLPNVIQLQPRPRFKVGELIAPSPDRNLGSVMEDVLVKMCKEVSGVENTIYIHDLEHLEQLRSIGKIPLSRALSGENQL